MLFTNDSSSADRGTDNVDIYDKIILKYHRNVNAPIKTPLVLAHCLRSVLSEGN